MNSFLRVSNKYRCVVITINLYHKDTSWLSRIQITPSLFFGCRVVTASQTINKPSGPHPHPRVYCLKPVCSFSVPVPLTNNKMTNPMTRNNPLTNFSKKILQLVSILLCNSFFPYTLEVWLNPTWTGSSNVVFSPVIGPLLPDRWVGYLL